MINTCEKRNRQTLVSPERNEWELDAALKHSKALRQSIQEKAFTGRLVPQAPAGEPASELLARIKAGAAGGKKK